MQGRDDGQRQLLDVESLAGHLLPAGSVLAFLAGHRHELFPDDAFADLFPSGRGRPSIPADVIASVLLSVLVLSVLVSSVLVLQTIHNLPDRESADAVTFDLRRKAACGFALTQTAFHPSVLTLGLPSRDRRPDLGINLKRLLNLERTLQNDAGALGRPREGACTTPQPQPPRPKPEELP
jgi:hypothetical protein